MFSNHRIRCVTLVSAALLLFCLAGCVVQPVAPVATINTTPTASPTELPPLIATLMATTAPQSGEALASPDGQWRAEVVIYACTDLGTEGTVSYEELKLIESATAAQRVITQQQINCGGLGAFGLAVLCWSTDSNLLYFTDAREGVPDGAGEWQRPIFQFDLTTGQIQPYTGPVQPAEAQLFLPTACQ